MGSALPRGHPGVACGWRRPLIFFCLVFQLQEGAGNASHVQQGGCLYTLPVSRDTGRSWAVAVYTFDDTLTLTRTRARCFGTVFVAKCA